MLLLLLLILFNGKLNGGARDRVNIDVYSCGGISAHILRNVERQRDIPLLYISVYTTALWPTAYASSWFICGYTKSLLIKAGPFRSPRISTVMKDNKETSLFQYSILLYEQREKKMSNQLKAMFESSYGDITHKIYSHKITCV